MSPPFPTFMDFEASSLGPGQGACFTVRLPVPALVPSRLGSTASANPEEPKAPTAATRPPGKRQSSGKQPSRVLPRA